MGKVIQFVVALIIAYIVLQWLPLTDAEPNPNPPGPVRPDEPDFSKYEGEVYDAICKVKSKGRAKECRQLSGDVKAIIEDIDSGEINDNKAVVDALVVAFRKLPMSWYGQIRKIADNVLKPLTDDGSLSTPKRWASLLRVADRGIMRACKDSTGGAPEEEE